MNNTTTYLIIGIIGVLVGMAFAILLTRLKNSNKHDDVFNLTPEQRAERDESSLSHGVSGQFPLTPAECYPEPVLVKVDEKFPPLSECAKAMYPPASADSYPDLKDPEYERKIIERDKLRAIAIQREMEEKQIAQRKKEAEQKAQEYEAEEKILKEEAARIKTDLKKWLY